MLKKLKLLITVSALLASSLLYADAAPLRVYNTNALKWEYLVDMPGAQVVVLTGDPRKKEYFVTRVKLPAHFMVPPHSHLIDENDTVISGTYYLGVGTKASEKHTIALKPGSFVVIPANTPHFGWTKTVTVLQISGVGPWGVVKVPTKG